MAAPQPVIVFSRMEDPNRREFLGVVVSSALAGVLAPGVARAQEAPPLLQSAPLRPPVDIPITLTVNGASAKLTLDPRTTLLDALRESMHLTGSKKGCDHGQCGACTVHVNGRRVLSCLTLAVMAQDQTITTIEGLAHGDALHPMQRAFIDYDGLQCGYCTPGQIMSAVALLSEPCGPADDDVRECMSGNICRCGAYPNIVAAVQAVRAESPRG
jgi:xanthine dehydrogenase YagT iron-sulfur-binding subunit